MKVSITRHDWQLNRAGNDPTAGVLTAFLHSHKTVVTYSFILSVVYLLLFPPNLP